MARADAAEILEQVWQYLDDHADVVDDIDETGIYQRPNRAMSLLEPVRRLIKGLDAHPGGAL